MTLESFIVALSLTGIALHLVMRTLGASSAFVTQLPLYVTLAIGGVPLLVVILRRLAAREFGADILAALCIVTSIWLHEYLAGSIIVLMLSGGRALEALATRKASGVLETLARRMPQIAHRKGPAGLQDIATAQIAVGDKLVVFPQETCPVDGQVLEGRGTMDESYLTGEPFEIEKAPGSRVLSGTINQDAALTIVAEKLPQDSRYARIMQVMKSAEENRPRLRRIADRLGALYAPIALTVAAGAWAYHGDPIRFLSVLMIATPCPLLIAIPVAVIGAISLAAKRSIIIKNPAILEQISTCRTIILDKTGTLTYGKPALTAVLPAPGFSKETILGLTASLERYSKHPLAGAIVRSAETEGLPSQDASDVSEKPGAGLTGTVDGKMILITGRKNVPGSPALLPPMTGGLECIVLIDGVYAGALQFHDAPRPESRPFIQHLPGRHQITKVMLVSGDRESEVRYLAREVGITDVHAGKSPEEKVAIVRAETSREKTIFIGDGINDAPALVAATVGIAIGANSDVTSEAASAVILDASLTKVDELFHISNRMRAIALQSAVGGMALSVVGMGLAAAGHLSPVAGAVGQEVIDLLAVFNAVRVAIAPRVLSDHDIAR